MRRSSLILSLLLSLALPVHAAQNPLDAPNRQYVHERYQAALNQYNSIADGTGEAELRAEALYLAGRCLENLERWNEAVIVYNQVTTRFPQSPWRNYSLLREGDCYSQLSQWDRAVEAYNQVASATTPPEIQMVARLNRGVLYANPNYTNNDFSTAFEDLSYVTANGRDAQQLAEANFALAELNRTNGNIDQAKIYYNVTSNVDRSGIWASAANSMIAGINAKQGKQELAIDNYQQVAEDPMSPQPLKQIARQQVETIQSQQRVLRDNRAANFYEINADRVEHKQDRRSYTGNVILSVSGTVIRCDEADVVNDYTIECRKRISIKSSGTWIATGDRLVIELPLLKNVKKE